MKEDAQTKQVPFQLMLDEWSQWLADLPEVEDLLNRLMRARELILEIDNLFATYTAEQPFDLKKVVTEKEISWIFVGNGKTKAEAQARVSEATHHLHSFLDNLACRLAILNKQGIEVIKKTEYPLFTDETKYDKQGVGKISGLPQKARDLIRETQPFNSPPWSRTHPLGWLYELSIPDKHRHPHFVGPILHKATSSPPLDWMLLATKAKDTGSYLTPVVHNGPYTEGDLCVTIQTPPGADLNSTPSLMTAFVLGFGPEISLNRESAGEILAGILIFIHEEVLKKRLIPFMRGR